MADFLREAEQAVGNFENQEQGNSQQGNNQQQFNNNDNNQGNSFDNQQQDNQQQGNQNPNNQPQQKASGGGFLAGAEQAGEDSMINTGTL
jgi:hypothetical protein